MLYSNFRRKTVDRALLLARVRVLEHHGLLVGRDDALFAAGQHAEDFDHADEELFARARSRREDRHLDPGAAVGEDGREDARDRGLSAAAVRGEEDLLPQLLRLEALLDLRQAAVEILAVDRALARLEHRIKCFSLHRTQLVVFVGLEVGHAEVNLAHDGITSELGLAVSEGAMLPQQRAPARFRIEEALPLSAVCIFERLAQAFGAEHSLRHLRSFFQRRLDIYTSAREPILEVAFVEVPFVRSLKSDRY